LLRRAAEVNSPFQALIRIDAGDKGIPVGNKICSPHKGLFQFSGQGDNFDLSDFHKSQFILLKT
jgi:hypothetical protein